MKTIKIKSPLVDKEDINPLLDAGANEFFCGIEPYIWRRKYNGLSINQRSGRANFTKLKDLEKAISVAHQNKARVHIAVNAFFYLKEQYETALRIIADTLNIGADGIIFADPALLMSIDSSLLRKKDVIVGCDATVFNSAAVKFYKELGATRIVLPRSLTLSEIKEIAQADASMEYEVFIINDLCFFEDGFCAYCKESCNGIKKEAGKAKSVYFYSVPRIPSRGYDGGCRAIFKKQRIFLRESKCTAWMNEFSFWSKKNIDGCGACAIYDFKQNIGSIDCLKVLDRNLVLSERIKATLFIKKSIDLMSASGISREEYMRGCKDIFRQFYKKSCNINDCYYPSVFLNGKRASRHQH